MYKPRRPYKNLSVDTTAMSDVAFLLLIFFMFASRPAVWTPMNIHLPTTHNHNISDPEVKQGVVYIGEGKIMYDIADSNARKLTLQQMAAKYHIKFSSKEVSKFAHTGIIGTPIANLKEYIGSYINERSLANQPGIPAGTGNNELADWISQSENVYKTLYDQQFEIQIEAGRETKFPQINYVFNILGSINIFSFDMATNRGHLTK